MRVKVNESGEIINVYSLPVTYLNINMYILVLELI
jgi:hypothetical protein